MPVEPVALGIAQVLMQCHRVAHDGIHHNIAAGKAGIHADLRLCSRAGRGCGQCGGDAEQYAADSDKAPQPAGCNALHT